MRERDKTTIRSVLTAVLVLLLLRVLFETLYCVDNKYTHTQPRGEAGVLCLTERDLDRLTFLIDGWMLSVDGQPESETFIGQYSNYSYAPGGTSPYGVGRYRITLCYDGEPRVLALEIPEVFTEYTLWADGVKVAENGSGAVATFPISGCAELIWEVQNTGHYYSGIYYPPALGTASTISHLQFIRNLFYGIICISTVTLALFSAVLWLRRGQDQLFFHFGLLCFAFAVSCIHPFLWQLGENGMIWYAVEDTARMMVWLQALRVAAIAAGLGHPKLQSRVYVCILILNILHFAAEALLLPRYPELVTLNGVLVDVSTLLCWLALAVCTGVGLASGPPAESLFTLAGCCTLGVSLFSNLLDNNIFEPIYTGWQGEWAGFVLVLIFSAMMVWRNAVLLRENESLTLHLEETVAQRTEQLEMVIEERKQFFSDMAHNLKAPIAAIHGFISLIREGSVGVDDELLGYLTLIELENLEMQQRVQALNTMNAFDRMKETPACVEVNSMLREVRDRNEPEATAMGVTLTVKELEKGEEAVSVRIQWEKMQTLFENLIYNALSFTPIDGSVTISPRLEGEQVVIDVTDTGRGIPPEKLPHIFERFYVGRENQNEGSGLGLYIVRLTAEEAGGSIAVRSAPGEGSTFTLTLPRSEPEGEPGEKP